MSLADQLTSNFYRWEQRGRGVEVFPAAVELEPPFAIFPGHRVRLANEGRDTGTKTTFFSRLADKAFRALQPPKAGRLAVREPAAVDDAEPEPDWFGEKEPVVEISLRLPGGVAYPEAAMAHFLTTLSLSSRIVGLELIGTTEEITLQLACQPEDTDLLMQQLEAQFPDAKVELSFGKLLTVWQDDEGLSERLVLDFGLHREFMRPLETGSRIDPFVSLIGGMAHLAEGEVAVYQCLFTPLRAPWAENALAAVMKENGKPFFDDGADLVKETQAKVSRPLYGVVLRLASKADSLPRAWDIVQGMAPALRVYSREGGQSLMPLPNTDYDDEAHSDDLLRRRSRRCGMILNLDELAALVHWPSPAVKCEKLRRVPEQEPRRAPYVAEDELQPEALILGDCPAPYGGEPDAVILNGTLRLQHVHIIGGSGTGKSTLLLSLLEQDIEYGRGFALLDPHGDLADAVLARIPEERLNDVVFLDPSDEQHIVPLNVISAHSDYEKTLLASDLVGVFRRLSTSWGDRMNVIFQNLILAFLEHRDGGTLADMRRFLVDEKWRAFFLAGVEDPDVQFYWQATFPKLDGQKSVGPILTRLETLLTPKPIRLMVSQRENRVNFNDVMDEGRILIVRLPMGQIGKENAWMVGSLVMVKLQQAAMARARMKVAERRPFYCYVDECQHFVTPSMAEILSGARKYGLGLVLAHQDLHQLSHNPDVAAAVMSNAATRIVFRASERDGHALKGDFAHYEAKDFASLGRGEAICRILRADQDFDLRVVCPDDVDAGIAETARNAAIRASRSRYAVLRTEVEAEMRRQMADQAGAAPSAKTKPVKTSPPDEVASAATVAPAPKSADEETPPIPPSSAEESAPIPMVPPEPTYEERGKGGAEHRAIQAKIRAAAEKLGFRAETEAQVGDGHASVDVVVRRDSLAIACEISVTTPAGHELANLKKCLSGEFTRVVMLSEGAAFRAKMREMAERELEPENLEIVAFHSPDEFIEYLESLENQAAARGEKRVRGFKVTRTFLPMSPAERRAFSEKALQLLAEEMKQPPPKD